MGEEEKDGWGEVASWLLGIDAPGKGERRGKGRWEEGKGRTPQCVKCVDSNTYVYVSLYSYFVTVGPRTT